MTGRAPNRPLHVLVVEDEAVIALHLQELLFSAGHTVIGPFSDPKQGLEAVRENSIDLAILDVMVQEPVEFSLPAELRRQGIPFLFVTGALVQAIPTEYRDHPTLQKPFATADLARLIETVGRQRET